MMINRRHFFVVSKSFCSFANAFVPVFRKLRKSKIRLLDCFRAARSAWSIVYLPSFVGAFISHSRWFMRRSAVFDPLVCLGGKSSTSKPCSVKNTTVLNSCRRSNTPFGVIFLFFWSWPWLYHGVVEVAKDHVPSGLIGVWSGGCFWKSTTKK